MTHCAYVDVTEPGKKVHCWVSEVGHGKKPARCEFSTPFLLNLEKNTSYLISICDSFDAGEVLHHGTVLVLLKKKRGNVENVSVKSQRWELPTDGSSYYGRRPAKNTAVLSFKLQNVVLSDHTEEVFIPVSQDLGTEDASDDYSSPNYPQGQTFGGIKTEALERQWMLLFPGTIVPGEAGIPLSLRVGPKYARAYVSECLEKSKREGAQTLEEKARVFAGILSGSSRYINERTDDTKCSQIFGGQEDCDGFSISAAALFKAAQKLNTSGLTAEAKDLVRFLKKKEVHLVAGIAAPTPGRFEAHMWIMLWEKGCRPIFCEATSVHREQTHLSMPCYAWTENECFIFCETKQKDQRPFIGVEESKMGNLHKEKKWISCPAQYLLKMKVHSDLKKFDVTRYLHYVNDDDDGSFPSTGGRFSRYIRGFDFRDRASRN